MTAEPRRMYFHYYRDPHGYWYWEEGIADFYGPFWYSDMVAQWTRALLSHREKLATHLYPLDFSIMHYYPRAADEERP